MVDESRYEEPEERGVNVFGTVHEEAPETDALLAIEETGDDETSPDPTQRPRSVSGYSETAGRLLGMDSVSFSTRLNTGTFGMYAVASVVHPSARTNGRVRAWLTCTAFLSLMLLEVFFFM